LDGERLMLEESNSDNDTTKVWKDYFRDMKAAVKKGRFSELMNPIASGIILTSGILACVVDLFKK
jgi:hypothetical protein